MLFLYELMGRIGFMWNDVHSFQMFSSAGYVFDSICPYCEHFI